MVYKIVEKQTKPFQDQKPGTSGLRKTTKTFLQENYAENFVQCIFNTLKGRIELGGVTLVIGGDGRYHNKYVIQKVLIPMAAANGIENIIIGQNGILSTPAASHIIRKYGADGGIILTASHNPGGLNNDFGIKFNTSNGGPSPEKVTNEIYEETLKLNSFKTLSSDIEMDLSEINTKLFNIENMKSKFSVNIIDSVESYLQYLQKIFDFPLISRMITGADGLDPFLVTVDAMNGVMGPYAKIILGEALKVPFENIKNSVPLEDFGNCHPDPNLIYGKNLVDLMIKCNYDFGCAFDGDGDRNMILGKNAFFVSPSDSLAVVGDHLSIIPYFKRKGIQGFARSMPTSRAIDRVALNKGILLYEVPTGWKFFGNLMDTNQLSLCGEESFGMGSNHIREKDGLWAVLAWLSLIAYIRDDHKKLVSISSIVESHWMKYGRNYYTRYDYENCKSDEGDEIMKLLDNLMKSPSFIGKVYKSEDKEYIVSSCENFSYLDPVDDSYTTNQGIQLIFADDSRIIYRLSGTGSQGSTIRMYIECYESDPMKVKGILAEKVKSLVDIGLELCQVTKITGRNEPTVIT